MSYLLVTAKNEPINFGRTEKLGDRYQRPLERILEGLTRHKVTNIRQHLERQLDAVVIKDIEAKIDEAIAELRSTDREIGEALQFTDEGLKKRKRDHYKAETFAKEWETFKAEHWKMSHDQVQERYSHLISDVRNFITHMGDTSNLILDPDLDSYYLMDVTLLALPQNQDRIQEVISFVEPILYRKKVTLAERIQASVYAALLKQSDLDRVTADAQTVLNEDPNFYGKSETLQEKLPVAIESYAKVQTDFISLIQKVADSEELALNSDDFRKVADKALGESFSLWNLATNELDALLETRVESYVSSRNQGIVFAILGLFVVSLLFLLIARGLTRSITEVAQHLKKTAKGILDASQELVETSQTVANANSQQAAAVQTTAASLEEIKSMVTKSVDNAVTSRGRAETSRESMLNGQSAVDEVSQAMDEISKSNFEVMSAIETSNKRISEIVNMIKEIADKTKIINDIVFQTKLLSFNASVEAARAGEHGKGFAVVAYEVGNLAKMSGVAAEEIDQLIRTSIERVNVIIFETNEKIQDLIKFGKTHVETGHRVADNCRNIFVEVLDNVKEVSELVTHITQASEEQAKGVTEISDAMNSLDAAITGNSSIADQTAQQAERLDGGAKALQEIINRLEKDIIGRRVEDVVDEAS